MSPVAFLTAVLAAALTGWVMPATESSPVTGIAYYEPESNAREAATGVTGDLSVVGWLFGNQLSTGTGISSKGGPWEPRAFERPSKATLKLIQTNALPVADPFSTRRFSTP